MKQILIICYGPLHRDPRVLRQITALKDSYNLTVAGFTNPNIGNVKFFQLTQYFRSTIKKAIKILNLIIGNYESIYWHKLRSIELKLLSQKDFSVIIANDMDALPFAIKLGDNNNAKVIFDAHEYYPDWGQVKTLRNILLKKEILYQCRRYIPKAKVMMTVSSGIKKAYKLNFNVDSELFRNIAEYENLMPSSMKSEIHLVHHGLASPAREIEKMILMINKLESRFHIHFYLIENKKQSGYLNKLKSLSNSNRIIFHDPVPTSEIPREINKYDIGLFLLPPNNFNYEHALPNKFFEFIQARLAIAIGPSSEMRKYVEKYSLGITSKTFGSEDIADELNGLTTNEILRFKENSHKAAKKLNFTGEAKKLNTIISNIL